MRRFLVVLLAVLIFTGCFTSGLKVVGPEEFKQDVQLGLNLLQEKAPEHYEMVNKYLKKVELVDEGINGVDRYGKFTMLEEAYRNRQHKDKTIAIALDLVHEATHVKRMKLDEYYTNPTEIEEAIAVEAEIEVAKLIGAPPEAMEWLENKLKKRWWEQGN